MGRGLLSVPRVCIGSGTSRSTAGRRPFRSEAQEEGPVPEMPGGAPRDMVKTQAEGDGPSPLIGKGREEVPERGKCRCIWPPVFPGRWAMTRWQPSPLNRVRLALSSCLPERADTIMLLILQTDFSTTAL